MHLSWEQHLELSKKVSDTADSNKGIALALMGIGLSILSKDLLAEELQENQAASIHQINPYQC